VSSQTPSFGSSVRDTGDAFIPSNTPSFGVSLGSGATHPSVIDNFFTFTKPLEGYLNYMYTDELGLVTTGLGNLADPVGLALALPWRHGVGGALASPGEIQTAWSAVKAAHTSSYDAPHDAGLTDLRLDDDAIQSLIASKLAENERILLDSFPNFAGFPADAQMAIHGMSWAMGPAFPKPKAEGGDGFTSFAMAANSGDWQSAKAQSKFNPEAPARKTAHDLLFDNATAVVSGKGDITILWYPAAVDAAAISKTSSHWWTGAIAGAGAGMLLGGPVGAVVGAVGGGVATHYGRMPSFIKLPSFMKLPKVAVPAIRMPVLKNPFKKGA
jgi:hypothetical protein